MKTKFKCGEFVKPILVHPGDTLKVTLSEKYGPQIKEQSHSEEIKSKFLVSHWVIFSLMDNERCIGSGAIFGDQEMVDKVRAGKILVNPVEISAEEYL